MAEAAIYTDEIGAEICKRLANGEPLAVICRDEHMPHRSTVYDWTAADDDLARRIARAREIGFDVIAEDCLAIAEDGSRDYLEREDGLPAFNAEHVQRSQLRIETRLKLLAKWDPKRYGDKHQIEHSGGVTVAASAHDESL